MGRGSGQKMGNVGSQHHRQEQTISWQGEASMPTCPGSGQMGASQPSQLPDSWWWFSDGADPGPLLSKQLLMLGLKDRKRGMISKPVRLALESLHWPFKTTLGLGFLISKDYIVHYSYLLYCVGLELNLWYLWGMRVLQQSNSHEFLNSVHIKVMFTWHWCLLMCINIVSKKIRTLILKYFIAKNDNHDQPLVHYNILSVEGLASSWWLLTDQGGGCWRLGWLWQILKVRQGWQLPHWLTPPFRNNFSVSCSDVWWHFTHSRVSSKIWINPLKPYHCFISQVHVIFYFLLLLPFQHSSQHLHKELTPCQEITFLAHLSEAMAHPLKFYHEFYWVFLVVQLVKNLPAMQETQVQSLGGEDPLEKEMAAHSSILLWKIPWTEEPGRLQSMGSPRVGHNLATKPPPWDSSNSVSSSGSTFNSSSLAISTISAGTSSIEVLNPSKSSRRAGVNFFQTHVHIDILTASYESLMSFMASRMVNPFQKGFNWVCYVPSEESLSLATIALWNVFLK